MIFRALAPPPSLPEPYALDQTDSPTPRELDRLLVACGDPSRPDARLARAMAVSDWFLSIRDGEDRLVGYVRATSDRALNANLWNLAVDPDVPDRQALLHVLLHRALTHLKRELAGCSISLSAPPESLDALRRLGFVVDPGGIRAMGLRLTEPGNG
jgi:hypothetical protein